MNELISIIVPIYNVEKYLEKCINSILNQTYTNLEIILVNDGSTDGSGHICDKYALFDTRIRVIHKKNGGLSDARNVGLDIASGKYYSFIDSDDYISDETIKVMYESLIHNDCDMAVCNMIRIYDDGSKEEFYCPSNNEIALSGNKRFETLKQPSVCNKLFRAELFNSVRFPKGKIYEDTFIYHILAYRSKGIVLTGYDGYWYFCRKTSILGTKAYSEKYFDCVEAVYCRALFLLNNNIQPYADEACLSLYVSYATAVKHIKKTKDNNKLFNSAKKQYELAYNYLMKRNVSTSLKQKVRLILLKYFPVMHNQLY